MSYPINQHTRKMQNSKSQADFLIETKQKVQLANCKNQKQEHYTRKDSAVTP